MRPEPKIATCCYCGTRSVLKLTGDTRHELSCRACGALLHNMKPLPRREPEAPKRVHEPDTKRSRPPKRRKSQNGLKRFVRLAKDIVDEIEDIFD